MCVGYLGFGTAKKTMRAVLCCDEQTKGNFATLMSRHTFWCDVLSAARSTRTWHAFVSVFGGFGIRRLPVY
jgi:hypothetical protein